MLNARAAKEALPKVIEIMSQELHWSAERKKQEYESALIFLKSMGLDEVPGSPEEDTFYTRNYFAPEELSKYKSEFDKFDKKGDGSMKDKDLGKILKTLGVQMNQKEIDSVVSDVHLSKLGSIEFNEFLEVLAAVKEIRQRDRIESTISSNSAREQFSTERSGGGV
jgi:glycerol-3-phosphate dehydrogenase